jgi:hypothetical protein
VTGTASSGAGSYVHIPDGVDHSIRTVGDAATMLNLYLRAQ